MNKWTGLYIKLDDGTMKRIGNVNPSTGATSFYFGSYEYSYSPNLYFVDAQGNYQQYQEIRNHNAFLNGYSKEDEGLYD